MKNFSRKNKYLILSILVLGTFSCEDFVQVNLPNSQISSGTVFENDETAIAAATGMYNTMLERGSFVGHSFNPISYLGGLSSDELTDFTGTGPYAEFYDNQLSVNNSAVLATWSGGYKTIYEANAVIEGVMSSHKLSGKVQRQLEGEGKFVRAFSYFYLVNLFGDIPLLTSTDYRTNATVGRISVSEVYRQIVADLRDAKELLSDAYFTDDRIRPNKWAATALLARVYLYMRDYATAESEASEVIGNSMYTLEADLNNISLPNNSEAILQLSQVYPFGFPTADGLTFYISPSGAVKALRSDFVDSFETGDLRKDNWIGFRVINTVTYYRPYKYKVRLYFNDGNYPENLSLLRLAEQYLIRAEARMELGKIEGAKADLDVIRNRAGLGNTGANDQASLRLAIEQERSFEFFCEMGHRWLDLKRTNRADAVLGSLKMFWNSTDVYYPIPEQEMLSNARLTPQNDGY